MELQRDLPGTTFHVDIFSLFLNYVVSVNSNPKPGRRQACDCDLPGGLVETKRGKLSHSPCWKVDVFV